MPILIKKAVQKAGERFTQQSPPFQNYQNQPQQPQQPQRPVEKKKIGEYVDYEEID